MLTIDLVVDKSFPHGVECNDCGKTAKVGDFVAWQRKRIQVPVPRPENGPYSNRYVATTVLFHKECIDRLAEAMPFNSSPRIEAINQQVSDALVYLKEQVNDRCSA